VPHLPRAERPSHDIDDVVRRHPAGLVDEQPFGIGHEPGGGPDDATAAGTRSAATSRAIVPAGTVLEV
jgi:hypothetical protein